MCNQQPLRRRGRGRQRGHLDQPNRGRSAWKVFNVDSISGLSGASCTDVTTLLCVAVDGPAGGGNVVTSTNPTGGASAWTLSNVDGTNNLSGVSCPSSSLCVGVDGVGNVVTSTSPTTGAWAVTNVDGSAVLSGVSCTDVPTLLCVAVDQAGDVITSTSPESGPWSASNIDSFPLEAVSCPSAGLCVAVDQAGEMVTSTNPTGGSPAWTPNFVSGAGFMTSVSCTTTPKLACVAVDGAGNVITSSNPTGGSSAWTVTNVDSINNGLDGVSCPSSSFCVAVDFAGNVVTGLSSGTNSISVTSPTSGASWARGSSHAITWSSTGESWSPREDPTPEGRKAPENDREIGVTATAGTYRGRSSVPPPNITQVKIISTTTSSSFGISGDFSIT